MAKKKFPESKLTVDMVTFTIHDDALKVLLIKRGGETEHGKWALPGGYIDIAKGEVPEVAAARELGEETSLNAANCYMEQLHTFASATRDPRGYTTSIAHLVYVPSDMADSLQAADDADDAKWVHVTDPGDENETWVGNLKLAFDHGMIFQKGHRRLTSQILKEPRVSFAFLPEKFTQPDMKHIFEIILGRRFSKQAMAKRYEKLVSKERVVATGETKNIGQGRPQNLYRVSEAYLLEMSEE